ncbi:hypothetical protein T484DRAFT_3643506 [Baffinella frigidus]|nr:hypothetical protein T484DRAFT_3643506 [Cryptophyta sp. CCMP2293]
MTGFKRTQKTHNRTRTPPPSPPPAPVWWLVGRRGGARGSCGCLLLHPLPSLRRSNAWGTTPARQGRPAATVRRTTPLWWKSTNQKRPRPVGPGTDEPRRLCRGVSEGRSHRRSSARHRCRRPPASCPPFCLSLIAGRCRCSDVPRTARGVGCRGEALATRQDPLPERFTNKSHPRLKLTPLSHFDRREIPSAEFERDRKRDRISSLRPQGWPCGCARVPCLKPSRRAEAGAEQVPKNRPWPCGLLDPIWVHRGFVDTNILKL